MVRGVLFVILFLLTHTAGNELCYNHTILYFASLLNRTEWALRMLDASTKIPENVLMGQTTNLGNVDECVSVREVHTHQGTFSGKHCLVSFQLVQPTTFNNTKPDNATSKKLNLRLSYCIPSTCSAKDLQHGLNFTLRALQLPIVASVDDTECYADDAQVLAAEDWVAVGVFLFVVVLVMSSTAYDLVKKGTKQEVLTVFSIYKNGKILLKTEQSADTLQCLHGIRFISTCWVIWAHRYLLCREMSFINNIDVYRFMTDWRRLYITNATLSVDTFLLLSGLLISYVFLKRMKNRKCGFNVPLYYLHRFIRLTPPYAMVLLFNATLLRYMSSAPLFRIRLNTKIHDCQNYWWTNLLYFNNYIKTDSLCMIPSWYLALDMQLFLLSPLLLYPLWKWPQRFNVTILMALTFTGFATPFTISYLGKYPVSMLFEDQDKLSEQWNQLYVVPQSRFGAWVIGIALGYLIYEAKLKKIILSKGVVAACWILGIIAGLGSLYGATPFYKDGPQTTLSDSAFYNGFFRNTWALGVGIVIFLCVTGYGGPVNALLSWRIFPSLSRLTYSMYLVHSTYLEIHSLSVRAPLYFSDMTMLPLLFGDVVISLIISTALYLGVEAPTATLQSYLLGGKGSIKPQTVATSPSGNDVTEEARSHNQNSTKDPKKCMIRLRIIRD